MNTRWATQWETRFSKSVTIATTIAAMVAGLGVALAGSAVAQGCPPVTVNPELSRLERDLTPSAPTEFFTQGRSQFEREIQRLNQPEPSQPILKISTTPIEQPKDILREWFKSSSDRSMQIEGTVHVQ
ncbi:MAG: hypothetical protein B0A82_24405 [Alkalinema sp. CACIAM 70d]|nr:MAG: hypothetical protein B0A82_24405 [Alkalinema sp. CACIAM 70d]